MYFVDLMGEIVEAEIIKSKNFKGQMQRKYRWRINKKSKRKLKLIKKYFKTFKKSMKYEEYAVDSKRITNIYRRAEMVKYRPLFIEVNT